MPSLSRYHCKCIFDEGSILNYCLVVHCTKGQVGREWKKRVLALRRLVRRLNVLIAEAFIQLLFKQVAGRRVSVRRDLEGEELSFSD